MKTLGNMKNNLQFGIRSRPHLKNGSLQTARLVLSATLALVVVGASGAQTAEPAGPGTVPAPGQPGPSAPPPAAAAAVPEAKSSRWVKPGSSK